MQNILQKSSLILGLVILYIAVSFFLAGTSNNKNVSLGGFEQIFANITFDAQNSSTWYNASNPTASVSVSPSSPPAPVAITVITRQSH
ncbi:hypothetical protein MK079_00690 [Candidatus Gracilibacteria bacterium]|nr:hypothetical protein [Candidatus Gracilibacteria bacterium]